MEEMYTVQSLLAPKKMEDVNRVSYSFKENGRCVKSSLVPKRLEEAYRVH
jgi:hypothetical protein